MSAPSTPPRPLQQQPPLRSWGCACSLGDRSEDICRGPRAGCSWDAAGGWPSRGAMKLWAQAGSQLPVWKGAAVEHLPHRPQLPRKQAPIPIFSPSPVCKSQRLPALCFLVAFSSFELMCLGGCSKVGVPWRWRQRWGFRGEGSQLIGENRAPSAVRGAGVNGHMPSALGCPSPELPVTAGTRRETELGWAPRSGLS